MPPAKSEHGRAEHCTAKPKEERKSSAFHTPIRHGFAVNGDSVIPSGVYGVRNLSLDFESRRDSSLRSEPTFRADYSESLYTRFLLPTSLRAQQRDHQRWGWRCRLWSNR